MQDKTPVTADQDRKAEELVRAAAKDDRLPCAGALAIAKSLGIPAREVGRIANRLHIKISKCQLGCF